MTKTNSKLCKNIVIEYLENLESENLIQLHNERCMHENDYNYVYSMKEFNSKYKDKTPLEITRLITYFVSSDNFFSVNEFNTVFSFNDIKDLDSSPLVYRELASFIINTNHPILQDIKLFY